MMHVLSNQIQVMLQQGSHLIASKSCSCSANSNDTIAAEPAHASCNYQRSSSESSTIGLDLSNCGVLLGCQFLEYLLKSFFANLCSQTLRCWLSLLFLFHHGCFDALLLQISVVEAWQSLCDAVVRHYDLQQRSMLPPWPSTSCDC